jgi:hypothetical protein
MQIFRERKTRKGNDMETSEVLSPALVFHRSNNSMPKVLNIPFILNSPKFANN